MSLTAVMNDFTKLLIKDPSILNPEIISQVANFLIR